MTISYGPYGLQLYGTCDTLFSIKHPNTLLCTILCLEIFEMQKNDVWNCYNLELVLEIPKKFPLMQFGKVGKFQRYHLLLITCNIITGGLPKRPLTLSVCGLIDSHWRTLPPYFYKPFAKIFTQISECVVL